MSFLCFCKNHIFIALFLTAWRPPPGSHLLQNLVKSWFLSHINSLLACAYTGTRWSLHSPAFAHGYPSLWVHCAYTLTGSDMSQGMCGRRGAPRIHVLVVYAHYSSPIIEKRVHFRTPVTACSWGSLLTFEEASAFQTDILNNWTLCKLWSAPAQL